jgi:hypothetical protein
MRQTRLISFNVHRHSKISSYEIWIIISVLCQTGFVYEMKTSVNTLQAVVIPFGDFTGLLHM